MRKVETKKIEFEKVAQSLNEWYTVIKQNNIPKATAMREKIVKALPDMEENQNVLLYFNLIDSRFKLMTENYKASGRLLSSMEHQALETSTDDMIQYYFYFFTGMYHFYEKDFNEAINYYRLAENWINKVPDKIERAEFHYQIAIAFYEIRQTFFSLHHAEQALEGFTTNENYSNKIALTNLVIAHNKLDLHQFKSAESLFKKAIEISKAEQSSDFTKALAYYNLGICYERQDKLNLAEEAFQTGLNSLKQERNYYTLRASYMLARVMFKKGLIEKGTYWYENALNLSRNLNETTYEAKLVVIHSIYKETNELLLDQGLETLSKLKLWSDVSDLSINAARYFRKQEYFELATKYFEKGISTIDKIQAWTEEVE
ncbi:aspartate phosphatase [Bacillus amyloliquefaciens]|nr:aspartate phosphatase [Bacillus amyloliquefaciens]WFP05515.1 tetratricopeptide repeat protein [Bacillus velezensis]